MTRAPADAAPMHADIAECSDSTGIYSALTRPSAKNCANIITTSVAGVIGYAATTSGFICRMASAIASFPVFAATVIYFTSFSKVIAFSGFVGHSYEQMPQPLQCL